MRPAEANMDTVSADKHLKQDGNTHSGCTAEHIEYADFPPLERVLKRTHLRYPDDNPMQESTVLPYRKDQTTKIQEPLVDEADIPVIKLPAPLSHYRATLTQDAGCAYADIPFLELPPPLIEITSTATQCAYGKHTLISSTAVPTSDSSLYPLRNVEQSEQRHSRNAHRSQDQVSETGDITSFHPQNRRTLPRVARRQADTSPGDMVILKSSTRSRSLRGGMEYAKPV